MTQRGKMIIVQLDDGTGVVEMTVFNELFDANRHMFREDELLIATGNARHDTFTGGVRFTAESVMDLAKARSAYASALSIALAPEDSVMERLRTVLTQYRAKPRDAGPVGLGLLVRYRNPRAACEIHLGPNWRVEPDEALLGELRQWLGNDAVELMY